MKIFEGMFAAIPTPFDNNDCVDLEATEKIVRRIVKSGMQGILVCGSTGEYSLMNKEERKSMVKAVCEIVDKKTKVIAGSSCHNEKDTIEMVKYAESVGADMALVLPPYYMQTTEEGIFQYFKNISDSVNNIGIVIYNYPAATSVELSIELIVKLSQLKNVIGIKNTTEMEHTSKLIEAVKDTPNFGVINGYEHLILGTLTSGGDGTMGIIHGLLPDQMMCLYNAVKNNDLHTAMEINAKLRPFYTLMEIEPCPAPIKASLEILGIQCGVPRKPLLPASLELKEQLEKELKNIGLV